MPLLLMCGQPCSGKTTVANKLAELLREYGIDIVIINETSLGLERNAAYKDATSEKRTRGQLKAAVERSLRGERVVILDAPNNIKGYRYELYCMARMGKARYCVTHCELPTEVSREWNAQRGVEGYSSEVFEDLAGRFESPDTRNRWDVPLLRVDPRSASLAEDLQPTIAAISGRQAATGSDSAPAPPPAEPLQPNLSTQNPQLSATNLLNDLDRKTQEILKVIIDAQAAVGGEAAGAVAFQGLTQGLHLDRPVNLPELRRHKRAFLRLATQNDWLRISNAEHARQMFVDYLRDNID